MKSPVVSLLALLILALPAWAETARPHRPRHAHGHIVGTHARHGEPGLPITAAKDSIRINAVGEVISQPVPVIQKEKNFDTRVRQNPSSPQPPQGGAPAKP